jgi:hypothetical protein
MLSVYAVMLFPDDMVKARGFASFALAKAMDPASAAAIGTKGLTGIANEATLFAPFLSEMRERRYAGDAIGATVAALFSLVVENPKTASWNHAVRIASETATGANAELPTSEPSIRNYLQRFAPVLHLWGAWRIRGARWLGDPTVGYSHEDDVSMFLCEAEGLLEQLRRWDSDKATQSEYLKADFFRVAEGWRPPKPRPDWPLTGGVPGRRLAPDVPRPSRRGRPARYSI